MTSATGSVWAASIVLLVCLAGSAANAQEQLFSDSFASAGPRPDPSVWTTEIGAPSYLGRTQLADWVTPGGVGRFNVGDTGAQLTLNTFNPTGFSLYGTHAKTIRTFQPTATSTIEFTTRLQLTSVRPGIVYAAYLYRCTSADCATHDEIDIELVTNLLQPGAPLRVQLNRYANEPAGPGHGELANLPVGFDVLAPHDWTIRWSRHRIDYLVDGVLLASVTTHVPQGPMQANIIAWAAGPQWPTAFHASLQPVRSAGQNESFTALVRSVTVREIQGDVPDVPTQVSAVAVGSSVNVSWRAPASGPRPTGHSLAFFSGDVSRMSPATLVAQVALGPETLLSVPVPPGTSGSFLVRVTAMAGGLSSLPSVPATFTVGGGCAGPPPAPTGLAGSRVGRMVRLRWDASAGATRYVVQAGSAAGATNLFDGSVGAATSASGELDTLVPLFVRLVAENDCGRSAPTAELHLAAPLGTGGGS